MKKNEMSSKELLDYISVLKRYRLRYEPDWYKSYYAYENNTFVGWNRSANTLIKMPYRKKFFMNLPEVKRQCDSLENMLLQYMPLFVIYPEDISNDKDREQAKYLSKRLKQEYIDWDANNIIHRFVHLAIKYPVSFWEISVENRMAPDGTMKKTIVPQIGDCFDYLFDPRIDFEDNQMIVKILRKTKREIQEYENFKVPETGPLNMAEDLKEMIFNDKYGPRGERGDMETIVVYQVMEKHADGIRKRTIDTMGNELENEFYQGANFYPVIPLQLFSGDVYQPSYAQNILPINRSLTLISNRIEDFILKFVKGAYLVRDGSDITFSDENGSIVYYSGEKPDVMPTPRFDPSIVSWMQQLFSISERYGINQYSMGLSPRGSQNRSAKQGQQATQQAQLQQKTPVDNLFQAFKRIAEITMYYLSEYTDEPSPISFRTEGQDFEAKNFIGEKYKDKDPNAIVIPHTISRMEVQIEDISESSMKQKREDLFELAQKINAIPGPFQKVLMDAYKVGSISDLMEDLEKSQTLLDNPEFQALIDQARNKQLPPEESQALITLLKFLSQQSPTPKTSDMGVTSKGGTAGAPVEAKGAPNASK